MSRKHRLAGARQEAPHKEQVTYHKHVCAVPGTIALAATQAFVPPEPLPVPLSAPESSPQENLKSHTSPPREEPKSDTKKTETPTSRVSLLCGHLFHENRR